MKILIAFLTSLLLYFGLQTFILYLLFHNPRHKATVDPGRYKLLFQKVKIKTANGKFLFGWYIPSTRTNTTAPGIVFLHGWGSNAATLLPLSPLLHQAGFAQLLIDARSHGFSDYDGYPSMVQFAQDLEAGLDWLGELKEINSARISVLGHSLGGAAALLVGSYRPNIAAIVSIASFAHSIPIIRKKMAERYIPFWPFGWWALKLMQFKIGVTYDKIAPINTIQQNNTPLLLIHGDCDTNIPTSDAKAIYDLRKNSKTCLWIIPGADHIPIRHIRREGERLISFLKSVIT